MTFTRHGRSGGATQEVSHMWTKSRWLVVVFVLALVAAACTGTDTGNTDTTTTAVSDTTTSTTLGSTTTEAPPATEAPTSTTTAPAAEPEEEDLGRTLDAPVAAITVDGDPADWALVPGLATTLEPIEAEEGEPIEDKDITVKMAHDDENIYAMVTVEDDYNWNADDAKLSGAFAML
ncbi:MAG: hypothetical protein ACC654_03940, partial [Acidimicrobiia bacterium]